MKKFAGKYEAIIENTITRFEQGGILSGDLVKFRKDAMKNEKVAAMMSNYKAMIEDAINTDLNLRVSAIKSIRPTTSGNYGNGHWQGTEAPTDHYVDIVVEYAPGLWKNPITVPIEVLERVDTGINLAPVPDSVKRPSEADMPKKVDSPDADRRNPMANVKPKFTSTVSDGKDQAKKPKEVKAKNQGKLTLESVYQEMMGIKPGAMAGAAPGTDENAKVSYTVSFGSPFMQNQEELIKRIQGMPGLDNNMDAKFSDGKTLILKIKGDIDPKELENMITNVVKGSVSVSRQDGMTEF